jgi:hypothetical protein
MVIHAPYFEEALCITDIDTNALRRTRTRLPLLRDERPAFTARVLNRILSERGRSDMPDGDYHDR